MTSADVEPAADMLRRGDWGERTVFLRWVVDQAACHPFVADEAGRVVGTGIATAYGSVGWVGTIFVDGERRGAGLGGALTRAVVADLEARGCSTQVLVATDAGRRIYEREGFAVDMAYRRLSAPSGPVGPPGEEVRAFEAAHLDEIVALDRAAMAEDRAEILRSLASAETTQIVRRGDGSLGGFLTRPPWGGGALIAPDLEDALRLLDYRRWKAPDRRVAVGLLGANEAGRARLLGDGWIEEPGGSRMIRGAPVAWHPEWVWGQLSGALG
jgi:GNAT superfamily N-acetyltransferase